MCDRLSLFFFKRRVTSLFFHRFTYPSSTATIYVFAQCVCNMRAVLSSGQKRRGFALRPTGCFRLGMADETDCVNNPPLNRFSLNKEDLYATVCFWSQLSNEVNTWNVCKVGVWCTCWMDSLVRRHDYHHILTVRLATHTRPSHMIRNRVSNLQLASESQQIVHVTGRILLCSVRIFFCCKSVLGGRVLLSRWYRFLTLALPVRFH